MTEISQGKPWLIYLLHFDRPVRGKQHYCGSTPRERLAKRMREHQCGSGANLTKQAVREGTGWTLAALLEAENTAVERRLKKQSRFKHWCPICLGRIDGPGLFPQSLHFDPVASPERYNLLSWQ